VKAVRAAISAWLYDRGPGRYYQPAYRHIASAIGLEEGRFLDVGCGPGWLSIRVAEGRPGVDAVGIDLSDTMLRAAEGHRPAHMNITFQKMDAAHIEFPEGTFTAAASIQSAHHWVRPEDILAEVHRVLQPGASFHIYEAMSELQEVPAGWIERRGLWPPDRVVLLGWRRFGMDTERWAKLEDLARKSPFSAIRSEQHGFYRRLVLTR